jgi:hypothetical protein
MRFGPFERAVVTQRRLVIGQLSGPGRTRRPHTVRYLSSRNVSRVPGVCRILLSRTPLPTSVSRRILYDGEATARVLRSVTAIINKQQTQNPPALRNRPSAKSYNRLLSKRQTRIA